ncbi:MAG TPA: hypothetical protein VJ184_14490, partial [Chryseolinea sp.]|nr:hypothetical protein [Chryseolinea sp.]
MEKRWLLKDPPADEQITTLSKIININSYLASILIQRGVADFESAKDFFRPSLQQLHSPFLMKGMEQAVARLRRAI